MTEFNDIPTVSRPLGQAERFFWLLDQVSPMSFSFYCHLKGELDTTHLQAAMSRLQEEQAMLRVKVSVEAGKAFFKPVQGQAIKVQHLDGDVDRWRDDILQQVAKPFDAKSYPLLKCFYMGLQAGESVVFFICHHAIADGVSISNLMQRLLMLASQPHRLRHAPVYQPNGHSLDELLPSVFQGFRGKLRALKIRSGEMRDWYRHGNPKHVLAFSTNRAKACQPACVRFKLSKEQTKSLLINCKSKGFSLQAVLITAQLYALNSSDKRRKWVSMAISSAVDVRSALSEPVSEHEIGLYMSFVLTALKFKESDAFWSIVNTAHQQLKSHLTKKAALGFWHNLPPNILFKPTEQGARRLLSVSNALSPASSIISNLGCLDYSGLSGIAVLESSFNLCPSLLTSLCAAVTTVNGELSVVLNFDRHKMNAKNVAVISETMRILLVQAIDT